LKTISNIRKEKAKEGKSVKAEIVLTIDKKTKEGLKEFMNDLKHVINAIEIKEGKFNVEFLK